MYLLRSRYHMYVLDPRNQGLSQQVDYGNRISRFATDLKEFSDRLGLKSADYCDHSMGAVILWSYIDLYGTTGIHKAVFVDEPVSISGRPDWSEQQRDFDVMVTSPAELVRAMSQFLQPQDTSNGTNATPMLVFRGKDTPPFVNSQSFASTFTKNDPTYLLKVLFDHASNDWHDIISHKNRRRSIHFTGAS